jgi:energy-coupling factor transport system permease protein
MSNSFDRDALGSLHPAIQFAFFIFVMLVTVLFSHPVLLVCSLLSSIVWCVCLRGFKGLRLVLLLLLPMMLIAALVNPLLNHRGATILFYIEYNPVTLEAILFGLTSAGMIGSVICWFSSYNAIMTSDRFLYIFGRFIPALALIISMALRLVARYTTQAKHIADAQSGVGCDVASGSVMVRARTGLRVLSVMVTWALENGVSTADAMVSRGYGLPGRTSYHNFRFDSRDSLVGAFLAAGAVFVSVALISGVVSVQFYPEFIVNALTPAAVVVYVIYALICFCPVVLNIREALVWRSIKSSI